jgi:HEAT repeat protein
MLPDERQNAWLISGLGKIGDPRAVEPLIAALEGNTPEASRAAAEALGHLGDVRAVGALILALEGNGHGVGCAAVRALVQIGDPRVVGALIGALKNRDHSVRSAAFDALVLIGDPRAIEPLTAAYLAKNCADGADAAIIKIGNTLGEKGDPRAIGPWVALLGHKDWSVRKTVSGRLVAMYESGTLDQAARLRILKEREVMANPHEDRISHDDCPDDYHEAHTDSNPHTDLGGSVSSSRFDPASTPASRLPHAGIRPGGGRASAGRL